MFPISKTVPATQVTLASDEMVMNAITVGTSPLSQNPESGAIMRVLMQEPGFSTRITEGVRNGHTYNVIHMPGSPNFILRDTWEREGKRETRYQSFVIANAVPELASTDSQSRPAPDMISQLLDGIEQSLDEFLAMGTPIATPSH